jgi:hypothetical protein
VRRLVKPILVAAFLLFTSASSAYAGCTGTCTNGATTSQYAPGTWLYQCSATNSWTNVFSVGIEADWTSGHSPYRFSIVNVYGACADRPDGVTCLGHITTRTTTFQNYNVSVQPYEENFFTDVEQYVYWGLPTPLTTSAQHQSTRRPTITTTN